MWASAADGNFNIYEDTESEPLERGTEIRIHLKEDASEYLEQDKLKVQLNHARNSRYLMHSTVTIEKGTVDKCEGKRHAHANKKEQWLLQEVTVRAAVRKE